MNVKSHFSQCLFKSKLRSSSTQAPQAVLLAQGAGTQATAGVRRWTYPSSVTLTNLQYHRLPAQGSCSSTGLRRVLFSHLEILPRQILRTFTFSPVSDAFKSSQGYHTAMPCGYHPSAGHCYRSCPHCLHSAGSACPTAPGWGV